MKMIHAYLVDTEKIILEEVPVPEPNDEAVIIEVKVCGICGTDIHAYRGKHPFVHPPIVLGHEFSGIVFKLGSKVRGLKEGDRVTVEPNIVCGKCYNCLKGRYNICSNLKVIGCVGYNGAFADYVSVPEEKVIKIPAEISFEEAALIEPTAVAVHAVKKSAQKIGDRILILGAGTVGLLILQVAKLAGAKEVIITDLLDYRLKKAKVYGADMVINPRDVDLVSYVETNWGSDGIDLIYDCVAIEKTISEGIHIARKGTKIIIVGVSEEDINVNFAYVQDRELELIGTLMYTRDDFIAAIDLIQRQKIQVGPLISDKYQLRDVEKTLQTLIKGRDEVFKILVSP